MKILTYYLPKAGFRFVYMLQQVEYDSLKFLFWLWRLPNLQNIQRRQKLTITSRAKILLFVAYGAQLVGLVIGITLLATQRQIGLLLLILNPLYSVLILASLNFVLSNLIVKPREAFEINKSKQKLDAMQATKIAVLGSYGKTTMKELLTTVLSEDFHVATSKDNKNVLISHARWVKDLAGKEELLIFEYGEAKPGDIKHLADFSQPDIAIITGLTPAHLDDYKSLDNVANDFNAIFNYTNRDKVFVNQDSSDLRARIKDGEFYSSKQVDGWKITSTAEDISGTQFEMKKDKHILRLKSGLVGRHLVGSLALVVALAVRLGLSDDQIKKGVMATKPVQHRMQPYQLGGAWVIDDTYNGNLEGMKAGLELLSNLQANRKIFVTPGLVEQGELKEAVHRQLGLEIAKSNPDKTILMENSTTSFILAGLKAGDYKGEIIIEKHPLEFYSHLEHIVAAGDVVLMQNDWTDNYL